MSDFMVVHPGIPIPSINTSTRVRCKSLPSRNKSSRSNPGLGLTQAVKCRASIFGTLVRSWDKNHAQKAEVQESDLSSLFSTGNGVKLTQNGDSDDSLQYNVNGHLVSGTLDGLVRKLVPTDTYYPDRTFIFAILLCSRLFVAPSTLLERVSQKCLGLQQSDEKCAPGAASNLLRLLGEWTDTFPQDFRDESLMHNLKETTEKCISIDQNLRTNVGHLTQSLVRKLNKMLKYEDAIEMAYSFQLSPDTDFTKTICEVCPDPAELARQLTLIDAERISSIGPEEFVQSFIKSEKVQKKGDRVEIKRSSNLESYVEWFNRLSYMVATEICMCPRRKERTRVIDFFLDTARHCLTIRNFNALMAIIVGLSVNAVGRMKKTWDRTRTSKFESLERQMSPENNFASYRTALKIASESAQRKSECVVPCFTLLLKDLYFLNEGVKTRLSDDHINFEKFWLLSKQVTEIMRWKEVKCPYEADKQILNYLLTRPVCSEDGLYKSSYEVEPPGSGFERDRYKSVRRRVGSR